MAKYTIYLRPSGEQALKELQDLMKAANPIGLPSSVSAVINHALVTLMDNLKKE